MSYFQFSKDDIMQGAQMGVMALLGLLVLLMVVRPLVRRIVTPEGVPLSRAGRRTAAAAGITVGPDGKPLPVAVGAISGANVTDNGGPSISISGGDEQVAISNRTAAMIDIAKVQGQVHAQSVQKVGELAENNPHEAVSIIRNWLHEEAA
jgi:flagellar M-ring protein FliF